MNITLTLLNGAAWTFDAREIIDEMRNTNGGAVDVVETTAEIEALYAIAYGIEDRLDTEIFAAL